MAQRKISQLKGELLDVINSIPDFNEQPGLDLFNIDDFFDRQDLVHKPAYGVAYQGSGIVENEGNAKTKGVSSSALITLYFQVIVVVEYTGNTGQLSLIDATDVLDSIRTTLYGYRGTGSRIWQFVGEIPYKEVGEGTVYYLQDWKNVVPLVGTQTT